MGNASKITVNTGRLAELTAVIVGGMAENGHVNQDNAGDIIKSVSDALRNLSAKGNGEITSEPVSEDEFVNSLAQAATATMEPTRGPRDDLKNAQGLYRDVREGDTEAPYKLDNRIPFIDTNKSVKPSKITSLESGQEFKVLSRHVKNSGYKDVEHYLRYWGLPKDYPVVSAEYSEKRRNLAIEAGLGTGNTRSGGTSQAKVSNTKDRGPYTRQELDGSSIERVFEVAKYFNDGAILPDMEIDGQKLTMENAEQLSLANPDSILCLMTGEAVVSLTYHLQDRGVKMDHYKEAYSLSDDYPAMPRHQKKVKDAQNKDAGIGGNRKAA